LLLLLAPLVASRASAYEVDTHRAISNVAIRRPDCTVDDYLKNELLLPSGILTAAGGGTLASRLEDGAENEDLDSYTRPRNHFYNPITKRGLNDIFSGTPSLQWAYDHADNAYDWHGARDAYLASFTGATKADRATALGNAFYALGHVIHLVQDLGQPQHTRNDAHITYFPGAPYEDFCHINYNTPAAITALGAPGAPSFAGAVSPFTAIPGDFAGFWDTNQYTGQANFTGFASTPGLSEFSNAYFLTDDTMFGTWRTGFLRRPGLPGLRVRLTEAIENSSTAARHAWAHPSLFDTDLASFYGSGTNAVTLQREGEDLAGAVHQVALTVRDATGTVIYTMPNLFHINNSGEIGFNAVNYQTWAQRLLPQTVAYSAGLMNWFFRGKLDIEVRWQNAAEQYKVTVTNNSGEALGAGTWQLYQDDAGDNRSPIACSFSYPGSLPDGASFDCQFAATTRTGGYTLVFHGTMGTEKDLAVVAKRFELVRVHITWTPNSDQDLMMWGPDGSIIAYFNLVTQNGELDNDNIGGNGPENITLKDLQPGRYEFLIDYYRDWWREQFFDSGSQSCVPYGSPINAPDDTPQYNQCFVQTPITVTMRTYHNSSNPVRTQVRTMNYPDYTDGLFYPGNPEGPVGDSWFVTQIVTVDDDRHVTIEGNSPQPGPNMIAAAPPRLTSFKAPRKAEGRTP
jgi:hypothetical protein